MTKDDNKVVKLRQPPAKVAGVGVDDPMLPKSLHNMTEVEQEVFLNSLRERRLRAAAIIKQAHIAKRQADSISSMVKIEKKAEQANKQYEKVDKALKRLEDMLYDLRAIALDHTDVDITKLIEEKP
jgi:hypothetical protein